MAHVTSLMKGAVAGVAIIAATASGAMAAGNVTVTVDQGQLIVTGDSADNDITISGTPSTSIYEVTGNNGTTINGAGVPFTTTEPANREIFIEMLSGSDTVSIVDATFTRTMEVAYGNGANTLSFDNVVLNKNIKLTMGLGPNTVSFVDSEITEPSRMQFDDGVDVVEFDNVEYRGGIFTRDGDDTVTILNSHHIDPKGKLVVKTGNDNDDIELTNAVWEGKVLVNGGAGNDAVTAGTIDVGVKAKISGAGDTDTLTNNGGHIGTVEFAAFE